MKTIKLTLTTLLAVALMASCGSKDDGATPDKDSKEWTIPVAEIFDGGPGKDGIPSLLNPKLVSASEANHLSDGDLVLGYKNGDNVRAYPHAILDWHEIINDKVNNFAITVTYCPLTGTGIGWERTIDGQETTFGVSGLLYNSNLILYDRLTGSNWSQLRLESVNGKLKGAKINTFTLIETTWKTWKSLFPETKVVSTETGHNRNYGRYPYGDYRTNNSNIIFPYTPKDERIAAKERVHGVIINGKAKAYPFKAFPGDLTIIEDEFEGRKLVIAGSTALNFIVSFERTLNDGTLLSFGRNSNNSLPAEILTDNEGNMWSIFGEAVSGPRKGQKLTSTVSFIGYWFSWGAFYPGLGLYSN